MKQPNHDECGATNLRLHRHAILESRAHAGNQRASAAFVGKSPLVWAGDFFNERIFAS